MRAEIQRLNGHFIVCGYGRIGAPVTEGLNREGRPFCILERDPAYEVELRARGFLYLVGDATDEEILRAAGVERASALLALLPSDGDNLYLTMSAKSLNPGIRVIARGRDARAEIQLKRGGADRVVSPYLMAAARVVSASVKPNVVEFMELVTHREYLTLRLEEIVVSPSSTLAERSLAEAEIRSRFEVIVVAVKKTSGEMAFNPNPALMILPGDILVAMGEELDLQKLQDACTTS